MLICGFDISSRLIMKAGAVLVLHTSVTVFEEGFFQTPGFHHGFFLATISFTLMAIFTAIGMFSREIYYGRAAPRIASGWVSEGKRIIASRSTRGGILVVFTTYAVSSALGRVAFAYVSMPFALVIKSSKIIPVMFFGRFITGKRYSTADYASAGALAAGVALFSLAGGNVIPAKAGPAQSADDEALRVVAEAAAMGALITGASLLAITLACDAVLGNVQEKGLQSAFGALLALSCAAGAGELTSGIAILNGPHGPHLLSSFPLYAMCMLAGTVAVLSLVEEFGAAAAVTVTLIRKISSMSFSYLLWPKPLNSLHLAGAACVFLSPGLHSAIKKAGMGAGAGGGAGSAADKKRRCGTPDAETGGAEAGGGGGGDGGKMEGGSASAQAVAAAAEKLDVAVVAIGPHADEAQHRAGAGHRQTL